RRTLAAEHAFTELDDADARAAPERARGPTRDTARPGRHGRAGAASASPRTTRPDAIVTAAPGMIRGHDDCVHIRGEEVALNPFINGVAFWENSHALFSSGLSPAVIENAHVMTGGF